MPVLCKPDIGMPESVVTMEETLELAARQHSGHPQLALALRLIRRTGVRKRHTILPIDQIMQHPGFEQRNLTYERHAKMRIPPVVRRALENAEVTPREVNAILFVSCTGFTMPSLTAWLINSMGFRLDTRQIPIAQLGCAAGGAPTNRAHDFCLAHPGANVLIVSCEFCSMCYQPTDVDIGSLLSDGLFGDAVAAAVVRGQGGIGMRLGRKGPYLLPHHHDWIAYAGTA